MRGLRGDRRNEKSPLRALTHEVYIAVLMSSEMGRNEKSPLRALTHFTCFFASSPVTQVEMKKAR